MLDGCVELSESSKSTEQKVGPNDPVSKASSAPEETGSNSDGARIKRLFSNASFTPSEPFPSTLYGDFSARTHVLPSTS